MKGACVMCERGGEQQPVRVKAPPQKRRVVIRVESAETQDCVSGLRGLEELGQEDIGDTASFQAQSVSRDGLCTCATTNA